MIGAAIKTFLFLAFESPTVTLKDPKISPIDKIFFVLSQKWCMALLFIILISSLSVGVFFFVTQKTGEVYNTYNNITRCAYGADFPVGRIPKFTKSLQRIVVTHTADEEESCTSQVIKFNFECEVVTNQDYSRMHALIE